MTALLQVNNLSRTFHRRGQTVQAVDNVSFSINAGETWALVGESGSGKSVTALSVLRLLPTPPVVYPQGDIRFEGQSLLHASESQLRGVRGNKIAMIFQEPMTALNPTRRIGKQMVDVIRQHRPLSVRDARSRAAALLRDMQIADPQQVLERYPFELSGGMRQRVMIAIAFSCDPDLLIADEPTTALDVTVQRQVLRLLKQKAQATGAAVLFISHDMAVVSQICDRVYVMYAGSVVESGATRELLEHPRHPYSIGLMNSAPDNAEPRAQLRSIPGTVPNLAQLPAGCAFRERCFAAGEACGVTPPLRPVDQQHVACWYPRLETTHD